MIGIASSARRAQVADLDFEVERLLTEHDLEFEQDAPQATAGPTGVDLRASTSGAVEALEIAAALEAVGVRQAAVQRRFGFDDVFDLAADMFQRVALSPAPYPRPEAPAAGSMRDLLRGLAFAVPGIAFTDVLRVGGVRVGDWVLPFALTLGWALGQVVATLGYTLRNRGDHLGVARLVTVALCGGVLIAAGGICLALKWLPGSQGTLVVGTLFVAFMIGSGVLLLFEEEWVIGCALVPAAAAYVLALTVQGRPEVSRLILVLGALSVAVIAAGALRHGTWRVWGAVRLCRSDTGEALRHLLHGACCGGVVSFVLFEALDVASGSVSGGISELVTWPLLITLGVMEWQLRSIRSALHRLRNTLGSVERYSASASRALARSLGIYAAAVGVATGAVAGVLLWRSAPLAGGPLLAQAAIGLVLFTDLVALSFAGVRRTLRCWLVALLPAVAAWQIARTRLPHAAIPPAAYAAGVLLLVVALGLVLVARQAVRSPFN